MFLEIYSSGNQLFSAMKASLWFPWITLEKYGEKKLKKINPECIQKTVKHPASVMVLGCFSHMGMRCMKFVEKTLKSDDYLQILKNGILLTIEKQYPEADAIFQQDLALYHKLKSIKNG